MENSLNILHFCIYKIHYRAHLFFNRINPFMLIHKLPFQKRRYEKLGIDIKKEMNRAFSDKNYGLSIMVSGGAIVGVLFILIMAFALLIIKAASIDIILKPAHFIAFALLSTAICYVFVFKNDKYLEYFECYEKWTKDEKVKYGLFSLIFIVAVVLLFVFSL